MTKDQKEEILFVGKMLAIVKDDPERFTLMKKYFHSKINEVLTDKMSNLRTIK
jgi:hypothetical protein